MKVNLKSGVLVVEFSKQERTYLNKAREIAKTAASLQPVAEPFTEAAQDAAFGLVEMLGMTDTAKPEA